MNSQELQLVSRLVMMRSQYGVVGVKMEFEAEGATFNEGVRLTQIACRAGLGGVALKIGGPEDKWGVKQALALDARDVVAPKVSDKLEISQFLAAYHEIVPGDAQGELASAINIETPTAHQNLDEILTVGSERGLRGITVGRVDMAKGIWGEEEGRKWIDSQKMFIIADAICLKAKRAGFRVTIGGAIERGSRKFLEKLILAGILDRFETRKVIFEASLDLVRDQERYESAIRSAHQAEIDWLESRKAFNARLSVEDDPRLEMLKKRVEQ